MALKTRKSNGVTILEPIGNYTFGKKDFNLKTVFTQELGSGAKNFVINLSGINKMDSSGLGELVLIHQMVSQKRGVLKLCDLSKEIGALIKMTNLNIKFEVFQTESRAVSSFR